jgi:hypothetical protein
MVREKNHASRSFNVIGQLGMWQGPAAGCSGMTLAPYTGATRNQFGKIDIWKGIQPACQQPVMYGRPLEAIATAH